ncbi:MAG: hypothetical protein ALECFALPRED_011136, partial [Alectoria fallacina]
TANWHSERQRRSLEKQPVLRSGDSPPIPRRDPAKAPKDPNLIEFEDLDPSLNPMNRAKGYKWILSLTMALMTLAITFASSRFSLASIVTAEGLRRGTRAHCTRYESVCAGRPFHLNSSRGHTEAALGFAFDPIIWGPTSELSGRHTPPRVGIFVPLLVNKLGKRIWRMRKFVPDAGNDVAGWLLLYTISSMDVIWSEL